MLDKVYGGERSYVDLNNRLCNVAQSYNESVKDYFERVIAIRSKLIKHHSHMYREGQLKRQAKECFFDGLRPEYRAMISHLKDDPTKNMLDLLAGFRSARSTKRATGEIAGATTLEHTRLQRLARMLLMGETTRLTALAGSPTQAMPGVTFPSKPPLSNPNMKVVVEESMM